MGNASGIIERRMLRLRAVCVQVTMRGVRAFGGSVQSMEKRGKHPQVFPVRVVASDGSTFEMASTLPMSTLKLNDDRFSHPEFTEGKEVSDAKRGGRIGQFLSRFEDF